MARTHGWLMAQFAIGVAAFFGGCGVAGTECNANDECSRSLYCAGPNDPPACGIAPREECASDKDCGMGSVCHAILDGCSPDGIGSQCGPPCTAQSCGEGLRCNAGGACETIPCNEGTPCRAYQTCMPGATDGVPVHARTSGCQAIVCGVEGDCPSSTACVNGACQSGPGTCREAELVP